MPRFFDDYSNTYLTHDSAAGRKQQRRGWKFRENFKLHYENHVEEWRKGGMGLASAQQAYVRAKGKDDPMIPPLPDGWKEEVDEATGITFYSHDESGSRSWVRPGFIPPPPGPPPQQRGGFRGNNPGGYRAGPPPPMGNQPPPFNQYRGPPPGPPMGGAPPPNQYRGAPPGQPMGNAPPNQYPPPVPPGGPPPGYGHR